VIGVDEGQFFSDLVEVCDNWANEGKVVIVAGLDATFQRKNFGKICDLIPRAEHVKKLTAICKFCGAVASFSKRLNERVEEILIGGPELYASVCRKCFITPVNRTSSINTKNEINCEELQ
jgi:thymidine kinase